MRGGASEAEGMPPYLPFLEALGQHIHTATSDTLCEQTGALASVLATLLPKLPHRLGTLPESYPLPPEQARLWLYEAVGEFLAAIAASQPLLLLLDDLQWANSATLDLLCYMARYQPDLVPLLWRSEIFGYTTSQGEQELWARVKKPKQPSSREKQSTWLRPAENPLHKLLVSWVFLIPLFTSGARSWRNTPPKHFQVVGIKQHKKRNCVGLSGKMKSSSRSVIF